MNNLKLLYGLDIPHESFNYKNLKMALKKLTPHISISYRINKKYFSIVKKKNCQAIANNARSVQIYL
jgi:hypothetical protein